MRNFFAIAATALIIGSGAFLGSANAAPLAAKSVIESAAAHPVEVHYSRHHGYRRPMRHRHHMMRHHHGHRYGWTRGRHNPHRR